MKNNFEFIVKFILCIICFQSVFACQKKPLLHEYISSFGIRIALGQMKDSSGKEDRLRDAMDAKNPIHSKITGDIYTSSSSTKIVTSSMDNSAGSKK